MKKIALLFACLAVYTFSFAESKTIVITSADFPIIYTDGGESGSIDTTIVTTNDLTLAYAGIKTQASAGSKKPYGYIMFCENAGYIYSDVAIEGYYPSLIKVTFSGSTGESGKVGIEYGKTKMDEINSEADGAVVKNGTYTKANTDNTLLYWNLSTTTKNVQIASIEITYTPLAEMPDITHVTDITIDTTHVDLYVYQSLQLTAALAPEDATIQGVVWESSDSSIVTVENGKITAIAEGSANITVTSVDNALAVATCAVTVTNKPKAELSGDVLTCSSFAATSTKYATTTKVKGNSGAEYMANSAKKDTSFSLRVSTTEQNASGITTSKSGGKIKNIYIDWNLVTNESNSLGIYVSHTPIRLDTLFAHGDTKALAPVKKVKVGVNCKYTITEDWEYVAVRAFGGACYIDQIAFEWEEEQGDDSGDDGEGNDEDKDDTALNNTSLAKPRSYKTIRDGQVIIIRDGKAFNLLGKQLD